MNNIREKFIANIILFYNDEKLQSFINYEFEL